MAFDSADLRPASYRGVTFFVPKSKATFGRITLVKKFPNVDKPFVEDLGRLQRGFKLEAFVIGRDYKAQRDRLRDAFEVDTNTAGPGRLVHPYWGTISVMPTGPVEVEESVDNGGMAKIEVDLVEFGNIPVTTGIDTVGNVLTKISALQAAISTALAFVSLVGAALGAVTAAVNSVTSTVRSIVGGVQGFIGQIQAVSDAINAFATQAIALINTPQQLANSISSVFTSVTSAVAGVSQAFANAISGTTTTATLQDVIATSPGGVTVSEANAGTLLLALLGTTKNYGNDFQKPTSTSFTSTAIASNQTAMIVTVRASAVAAVAQAVVAQDMTWTDKQQALAMRDALIAECNAIVALTTLDDTLFQALQDMKTAIAQHLNTVSGTLPEVVDFVPTAPVATTVLAYRLYNDITRDAEIVTRNPDIRHPGRIPQLFDIKVLSS